MISKHIKRHCVCQLHRYEKPQPRQLQHRINPNYKGISRLGMDLKVMSKSYRGHRFNFSNH